MLHITNGDSVTETMREASLQGEYLPWRDVLHDGPVPGGLTLKDMSDVRARALAGFGFNDSDYDGIRAGFAERDRTLEGFRSHDEVILWFEHDLYDQLQLLQLLDWFSRQELGDTKLSIIQIDTFPGVTPFYGLGQLNAEQLAGLFPARKPVTPAQLSAGHEAWSAFTDSDPSSVVMLAARQSSELPFLAAAFRRFLQEYPWIDDGLSRNERQILRAVAAGNRRKIQIYSAASRTEEVPWGDESIYLRMEWLASGKQPALERAELKGFILTDAGKALMCGISDWVYLNDGIDRWLGGVHLRGEKAGWRWNNAAKKLRHDRSRA